MNVITEETKIVVCRRKLRKDGLSLAANSDKMEVFHGIFNLATMPFIWNESCTN